MLALWLTAGILASSSEVVEPPIQPEIPAAIPSGGWIAHLLREQRRKREIEEAREAVEAARKAATEKRDDAARQQIVSLQEAAEKAAEAERDARRDDMARAWLALSASLERAAESQRRANMVAVAREMERLERAAMEAERFRIEFEADEDDAIALLLAA